MPDGTANRALTSSATSLADYQKQGGFKTFGAVQSGGQRAANDILAAVREARLRGRGGAGALVADKWQVVRDSVIQRGGTPYLVCNAYDADPRSLIASTLLTTQPFKVIEGIAFAAHAIGAEEAYLYLRSSNTAGYDAINAALNATRDAGFLSTLTITIVGVELGFMGGEESTMLQAIKGMRGMAVQRPPYPAQSGLNDMPTAIANVETLYHVAVIMQGGVAAFKKSGTAETPGTKFVTVYGTNGSGKLLEVPFGATVANIVKEAGFMITPETARGIAVGGPEGGVLSAAQWNTLYDFMPLKAVGVIVGSGTLEVLPTTTCMVSWAQERSAYLSKESCGKCIPCRSGVKRITGTLEGIISDVGSEKDLALLTEFGDYVATASLCGFGWNATHPLKTAMQYYPDDFAQHLKGECPTGTCVPVRSHRFATKGVL